MMFGALAGKRGWLNQGVKDDAYCGDKDNQNDVLHKENLVGMINVSVCIHYPYPTVVVITITIEKGTNHSSNSVLTHTHEQQY